MLKQKQKYMMKSVSFFDTDSLSKRNIKKSFYLGILETQLKDFFNFFFAYANSFLHTQKDATYQL